MVIHLDLAMVEVGKLLKDTLILDMAIQRIAMRTVVRVYTMGSKVVEVSILVQILHCCVMLTISNDDHQVHVQTSFIALGEEEPVGQASGTRKVCEEGFITSFSLFEDFIKTWYIWDSYSGLPGLAGITTTGHLIYKCGGIDKRTIEKFEKEAAEL